jgi:hypothetical protein
MSARGKSRLKAKNGGAGFDPELTPSVHRSTGESADQRLTAALLRIAIAAGCR